jgi:hypothetical protein
LRQQKLRQQASHRQKLRQQTFRKHTSHHNSVAAIWILPWSMIFSENRSPLFGITL